ncbi:MAG: ribonuclease HII [Spirulina sp. DLM2.Bin59]|nr:MAG: ribonuclease HII [Spirulina sp. DLM2.Bin59]
MGVVDEVGGGAWWGPVVAAAVLITPAQGEPLRALGVRDSKQLSARRRSHLAQLIPTVALDVQIAYATPRTIDRCNIRQASLGAMTRAIYRLHPRPAHCFVDGRDLLPDLAIPQTALIKGDQQEVAIAAASIIAKVWRDTLCIRLDHQYPGYGFATHKGYGTAQHREALSQFGLTPLHRRSFRPCQEMKNEGRAERKE